MGEVDEGEVDEGEVNEGKVVGKKTGRKKNRTERTSIFLPSSCAKNVLDALNTPSILGFGMPWFVTVRGAQ